MPLNFSLILQPLGFGIYLDNWAWLGLILGPLRVSLFKAQLLFKADAAYKIDLPVASLAATAAMSAATGVAPATAAVATPPAMVVRIVWT